MTTTISKPGIGIMSRGIIGLLICAAIALTIPARAEAQGIKGLIKKKVASEAKSEEKSANDPATEQLVKNMKAGDIAITDGLIDDFITGVGTEIRLLREFWNQLAAYKQPEQWQACNQQVAASQDMQNIMMSLGNVPEGTSTEEMQRIMQKMQADMQALVKRKCGGSLEQEWPIHKRRARLVEIQSTAADAFDAAQAARSTGSRGPAIGENSELRASSFSQVYYLLKDKIIPFCDAWHQGLIIRDTDGQLKFSFSTTHPLSLLYTKAEAEAQVRFCLTDEAKAMLAWSVLSGEANAGSGPFPEFKHMPPPGSPRQTGRRP